MDLFYIDANIYLGFYNSNRAEFKKLLAITIELKDKIFFTEQFKDEINRNKLNVFQQSIDNYIKQVSFTKTVLPEQLDNENNQLKDWNLNRKNLEQPILDSNTQLLNIFKDLLKEISNSGDYVSKELSKLYENAYKPNIQELNSARFRKEVGNPPGKRIDPLGDQLSWEMLLNHLNGVVRLWIISSDRDYFTEYKESFYLNPILASNISEKNPEVEVKVYNKLSEALKDFNKEVKDFTLPDNLELDSISLKESIDLYKNEFTSANFQISNEEELTFDLYDLQLLKLLSDGYTQFEIVKEFDKIGYLTSNSFIEKRINKLKIYFNALNTIHLISLVKDRGLI